MAQGRRIAATVILAIALSAAGAATAIALSVPGTTTTVTTPSATVPAVTTPVATTPLVTVPSTTTKVTTPPVSTGSTGSKPRPSGGSVTGSKPSVTVKSGTMKVAVGGSGGRGGGATGAVGGVVKTVGSTLSSGSSTGRKSTGSGSVLGTASGSSGSSGAGGSGSSPAASILGGSGAGPSGGLGAGGGSTGTVFTGVGPGASGLLAFGLPRSPSGAAGSGHLGAFASAVASLAGCFYALSPFEQQVLIVRTGLDGRTPLTRSHLALALGIPAAVISRTEQRALTQLEAASATEGCMPVATTSAVTAFVGGPFGPIGSVTAALAPASRAPAGGGESTPAAFASSSLTDPLSSLNGHGQTGPLWAALVIALLLATALTALGREWRRSVY